MINELFGRLTRRAGTSRVAGIRIPLAAIVGLIGEGTISGKIAKDLFEIVWTEGGDPRALVETRGMKQVTDMGAIEKAVDDIVAANPDKVGAGPRQAADDRLVRRSGDESVRRQGQSAGGERSAQDQARSLTVFDGGSPPAFERRVRFEIAAA